MKNILKVLSSAVLAFGFAGLASAQMLSNAYIGAGAGSTGFKLDSSDFGGVTTKDESDTGFKLFGGYRFNQWLSAEVAYADLGKAKVTFPGGNAEAKASSWSLAAVGTWPLAAGFSLLGKLGGSYNKAETTVNAVGGGNASKTKTEVMWGVGAGYDFSPRLGVRLEYEDFGKFGEQFQATGNQTGRWKANMVSGSIVYRF